jgi:hypothetical protein
MDKPEIAIFSSKALIPIGEFIRENLKYEFTVTPWTEGFFRSNEIPLNTFLKKLLCFDAAVVMLGADDLRENVNAGGAKEWVPRDNVIFELGACMSRLGTQKTFFVVPESPAVVLPTYFKGFTPLTYEQRADGNLAAAVGSACTAIKTQFKQMGRNAFYSDLPAQGLAFGYFFNFILPTYKKLRSGVKLMAGPAWKEEAGFAVRVVMPGETFMNRDQVDRTFRTKNLAKLQLPVADGRNIAVYHRRREKPEDPLNIFDVPTTLLTSERVIEKVQAFWGGGGEEPFHNSLVRREIASFSRALNEIVKDEQLADSVTLISLIEFNQLP